MKNERINSKSLKEVKLELTVDINDLVEIFFQRFNDKIQEEKIKTMRNAEKEEEILMTRLEVCQLLRISSPTLSKRVKDGTLKYRKCGKRIYFSKSEIMDCIKRNN